MIDIIIINHNSTGHLIHCLQSIRKAVNGYRLSVFVQDNASSDHIASLSGYGRASFPEDMFLTVNTHNLGFARAVNQALAQGNGKYAVLLNPDTRLTSAFFESTFQFMETHPDVGILGPRILNSDGSLQNSARAFPNPLTALFGRTAVLSRLFPDNPLTRRNLVSLCSDGKTEMEADWVSGACMVVRREAIATVGPMDERFFMYWEDADWCRRMWQKGWRVVYFPEVAVFHEVGGSSRNSACRSALEFHKSVYRLFEKYAMPPLSFLKPFVIAGLSLRLSIILLTHWINRYRRNADGAVCPTEGTESAGKGKP